MDTKALAQGLLVEDEKKSEQLKIICNLNNVACKLKLKDYKQDEKLCTKVLKLDSQNVNALYKKAQGYTHLADLELEQVDIKKALEIDPENSNLQGCEVDIQY